MALLQLVQLAMQVARFPIEQVTSPLPPPIVRPFPHLESFSPSNCQLTVAVDQSKAVGRFSSAILRFKRLATRQFHSCLMTEFMAVPFLSQKQMRLIQFRRNSLPAPIINCPGLPSSLRLDQYFGH